MVIVSELAHSLATLVDIFFRVLSWLLIIRIVLSWVGVSPHTTYHELLRALYDVTDRILRPLERLPLRVGLLDFSAIVALVAMDFLRRVIIRLLIGGY